MPWEVVARVLGMRADAAATMFAADNTSMPCIEEKKQMRKKGAFQAIVVCNRVQRHLRCRKWHASSKM